MLHAKGIISPFKFKSEMKTRKDGFATDDDSCTGHGELILGNEGTITFNILTSILMT